MQEILLFASAGLNAGLVAYALNLRAERWLGDVAITRLAKIINHFQNQKSGTARLAVKMARGEV